MNSWDLSSPIRVVSRQSRKVVNFRKIDLYTFNRSLERFFVPRFVFRRLENPREWIWLIFIDIENFLVFWQHPPTAHKLVLIKKKYIQRTQNPPQHPFSESRLHDKIGTKIRKWGDQKLEKYEGRYVRFRGPYF